MSSFNPHFWRAAGQIEHFLKSRDSYSFPVPPNPAVFMMIQTLTNQLRIMEERAWRQAARSISIQLHVQLMHLQSQVKSTMESLFARPANEVPPAQRELYAELVALATEFEVCYVDLRKSTLSVVTEPIVLEDVELGPFRIVLDWKADAASASSRPYVVQSLNPCCPDSRSDITHPHVLRDQLCEGDATAALSEALRSGRLTDFFQIINQVLQTYNSHSPYASLDAWHGIDCHACDRHVSHADASYCEVCDAKVCEDCGTFCELCDLSSCDACILDCTLCETRFCPGCAHACRGCGTNICPNCSKTTKLCQECKSETSIEKHEPANAATSDDPETELAVQPAGLGQIAVLA